MFYWSKKMAIPTIHFTATAWNRLSHLQLLVQNLREIWEHDSDIALHVAFFRNDKALLSDRICALTDDVPFPADSIFLDEDFNPGLGHNAAAKLVLDHEIVCLINVDLIMPVDITAHIRALTHEDLAFFAPTANNADANGKLHECKYAYPLISTFKADFSACAGMPTNRCWGGDSPSEHGEDVVLGQRLKAAGLTQHRPYRRDVICRWHERDLAQPFYRTIRQHRKKPWWDLVDSDAAKNP